MTEEGKSAFRVDNTSNETTVDFVYDYDDSSEDGKKWKIITNVNLIN